MKTLLFQTLYHCLSVMSHTVDVEVITYRDYVSSSSRKIRATKEESQKGNPRELKTVGPDDGSIRTQVKIEESRERAQCPR